MRRLLVAFITSILLIFNAAAVNAESFNTQAVFDTSSITSGIIKVSCSTDPDKKLKVLVNKSGRKISYNLKNDGTLESFPLQLGNGDYSISVMENIEGDKYKYISTENVSLALNRQEDAFLGSVQNINWSEDMAAIKKAAELTKGSKSDSDKVNVIYTYIVGNFKYDYDKISKLTYSYVPDIDSTLAARKGICYDYSSIFAAMLRSVGVPTKLVTGYSKNVNGYHAWNEVYNSETGNWDIIDTTYDSQMKAAKAKYYMVKENSKYTRVYEY